MARWKRFVRWEKEDAGQIPDILSGYVVLVTALMERGVIEDIGERIRIHRQGGYAGVDVVVYLLALFASEFAGGLRPFWDRVKHLKSELAALAGRASLMSSAALSRALSSVELERLRPHTCWLLAEATGADVVLQHPSVHALDATGAAWHLFHFDPTVTALRHRELPEGEDLPPARRRSESLAEAGYSGRKRGEVQFRRATLQHAGSGLWLDARLEAGNGDRRAELASAASVSVETCQRLDHPLKRALFLVDGEFGHVPGYTELREQGLPFITRLTRPKLFEDPVFLRQLAKAEWRVVPSEGSGPCRSACEVGLVTIPPGEGVLRDDGSRYEPITVRVVASRFPRTSEPDHGVVVDDWQVELFAVDVDASAWPAEEAVALYFGRGAQENRFAQEDRELGLDRVFSYQLPGQELACLVGLMVWNLRLVQGFCLDQPPAEQPAQAERVVRADLRPSAIDAVADEVEACQVPDTADEAADAIDDFLETLDWQHLLRRRPGWHWRPGEGLTCPRDAPLTLTTVDFPAAQHPRGRLTFTSSARDCDACPLKADCFRKPRPGQNKSINQTVDSLTAKHLSHLLKVARRTEPHGRPKHRRARQPGHRLQVHPGTPKTVASRYRPRAAPFRPRQARALFDDVTRKIRFQADVTLPPPPPSPHRFIVTSAADRQCRRKTWSDRLAWNALPEGASLSIRAIVSRAMGPREITHARRLWRPPQR